MNDVTLPALAGTNPLGFLAALGILDIVSRIVPEATLRWTDELVPRAVMGGTEDLDQVLDILDHERDRWGTSALLAFPSGSPLADAKPDPELLRGWLEAVLQAGGSGPDADLLCALVA